MTVSVKEISSAWLHQYLGVTQKTLWYMARRIREAWAEPELSTFAGPVEVDEIYVDGKEKNKYSFLHQRTQPGASVYTDEYAAYTDFPNRHTVYYRLGKYVAEDGAVSTSGLRAFGAVLKRAPKGVFHQMSPKTCPAIKEFVGHYNQQALPPLARMEQSARRGADKRLHYATLVGV